MKAETLANILREQAANHKARGDARPVGEDAIPYAIGDAFNELADALEFVEDQP